MNKEIRLNTRISEKHREFIKEMAFRRKMSMGKFIETLVEKAKEWRKNAS